MVNFFIERQKRKTKYYSEDLGNGIKLDMVLIPEGKFIMGAPESELDSSNSERPQHEVTVPTFFMGRYPVTQKQWQAIMINNSMVNNPSKFKEDNRPVERVSWNEAQEFCDKVSQKTEGKRTYRLPTEAEWEYACRAVNNKQLSVNSQNLTIEAWNASHHKPFHFGETISTELANYNGNYTYGNGVQGKYRNETTEVGSFPSNDFGLCEMHGNVWEWCEDDWHENYQDAPTDGSAWLSKSSDRKVLRSGSWNNNPKNCRSATRIYYNPEVVDFSPFGFRVVCVVTSVNS